MTGLRDFAIDLYRRTFGAPAGSDVREQGVDTVLSGISAVELCEAALSSHAVRAESAAGPRGAVAAATGLALAGQRATAFLAGPDLVAAQDLLVSAAGKHAPLVLHLLARPAPAHGSAQGSGHDTVHLCAESGFFVLFAHNVQQAIDFTFIARRVAEDALVPGLVVMDDNETAAAMQDARLLSAEQAHAFAGLPRDNIETPTAAQKLLFGDSRRRLPAWQDLDDPVLTGALFDQQSFALGAAARRPFFDHYVGESLQRACDELARLTGRQHGLVSRHRLDNATTILVAEGAAVETLQLAADQLRKEHGLRVGVLGIHALRPFPATAVAEALAPANSVFVLERCDATLSGDPPLTRELRACLYGVGPRPECQPVVYGNGGLPLRLADIAELCLGRRPARSEPLFLGMAFDDTTGEFPKRDVLLDTLRRAYPNAARLGVRAAGDAPAAKQADSLSITISRPANLQAAQLVTTAGALLQRLAGGRLRSRVAIPPYGTGAVVIDRLVHGDNNLLDPGHGTSTDVTLDVPHRWVYVSASGKSFVVAPGANGETEPEVLLGGLFATLQQNGLLASGKRQIISARRALLEDAEPAQRDSLMRAFETGFNGLAAAADDTGATTQRWDGIAPAAVRELDRDDDSVGSLPRFWDQTGVLYRDGMAGRLTADPYLATGSMPPLSATFSDFSGARRQLPAFNPALCTGCGRCWSLCPDSAIGVVSASPAALIDAGIRRTGAEAVRQVASRLASRIVASNKAGDSHAGDFGAMLGDAFAWLMEKAPLPDERRQAVADGIGRIVDELGTLPVAVTRPFFVDAEAAQKDSAELLSIVVNPEACKDCGICVENCEPGALTPVAQDAAMLDTARQLWETWSGIPDTSAASMERAARHPDVGATAAMMLSRYCQFAIAGGDPAEAGSGEKIAVRLALAATEFHRQPVMQRCANNLQEAGKDIEALIRELLSGTLPVDDLDALSTQIEASAATRVDLAALAESVADAAGKHSVDAHQVSRLIALSKHIASTREQLVKGVHGLGRARYGLAITGDATSAWAASFPRNPFQVPALIDMSGDAAQLAAGLVKGHMLDTVELVRLLRLARLEIDRPDGLDFKRDELAGLRWQDLDKEERALCAPLIVLGNDDMLVGRGLAQLIQVMNSGLPVKVLVLSSLDLAAPRGIGMLALAQRNAYVAQTCVAWPDHLGESVIEALGYDGPALLQVYAPSPSRHGFATADSAAQARSAVESRVLPLLRYHPRGDGVFGLRLELDGNPEPQKLLAGMPPATPADWALTQGRFAEHFRPLDAAAAALPLHEWLLLDAAARKGKVPCVEASPASSGQRLSLSPEMLRMTEQCVQDWQTLQELAGIVTPFTAKLEARIRAELAAGHEAELQTQREAATAELNAVRDKTRAELAARIRSRLLELATRKRS